MIVFKYTYDTSVVADFAPTFNNGWGYDYTTKTSTSGTLKTVTYESDTAFTAISIPNNNRNCVKSIYIDASGMTNLYGTFTSCQSMTDFTIVNATSKLTNLYQTTYDCTVLSNITYENCDLSSVTNIQNVFNNGARDVVTNATFKNVKFNNTTKSMISILCKATTMVVEDCDFSSVTSCYGLFGGCVGLKGTLDLSMYDFANVYETNAMFNECANLTKIIMPKGTFDKLTNCGGMFQNCKSLVEVDLSGFHIPNAQNMSYMFAGCTSIEEIDCSALGVLNPTNINHMFVSCQKLKRVNLSGIKAPKAISFSHMFYDSSVVEWIDISNIVSRASDVTNFWKSGTVVKNIGMLYCPADVINAFANSMVSNGNVCNIYYHDAKLEDLTVDSRFNYIYCEEYHGDTVSTPDDLELYDVYYGGHDIQKQDKLDLTTGIVTRNVCKWKLNDYLDSNLNYWVFREWDKKDEGTNEYVRIQVGALGVPSGKPTLARGWSEVYGLYFDYWDTDYGASYFYDGKTYFYVTSAGAVFMCSKAQILSWTGVESYELLTKQHIYDWFIAGDFTMMNALSEPTTEQISINPLKSYRNGSIQTSSQQLTPTLKTTLPISNKFTTTNLTSGQTYNIYFDGTATKLDAGGTIITNPVSPCEIECGGTTLTIEGTDIQNVRVIETTVKNEVGSVCGTTDVELNAFKTRRYENLVDKKWSVSGINWTLDEKTNTLFTNNAGRWTGIEVTTGAKYPKGTSLVHVEFDVDTQDNRCAWISFGNSVTINNVNFRDLKLNNDTARICQGNTSGIGQIFASYISKGHFSNLLYVSPLTDGKQRNINFSIYTDSTPISGLVCNATNCIEGSIDGYTACADTGVTISNMRIRVVENYPDDTSFSQHASLIRQGTGQVIWQDMDMTMPYTNTYLARPIKLRSLGTTYDSYNPVTGELIKRIGVSETDGSYSVLSSPIVSKVKIALGILTNIRGERIKLSPEQRKHDYLLNNCKPNTDYFIVANVMATESTRQINIGFIVDDATWSGSPVTLSYGEMKIKLKINSGSTPNYLRIYANSCENLMIIECQDNLENKDIPYFEGTQDVVINDAFETPHLYTNGQVKVYSDSEVYPTTILNGQSTNNYEVNELNKSNNYTIRYDGTCESINLNGKSNEQGTNRIVKTSTNGSGNLTFVNDSGDIDNVLLVQNDVREQEINHFNGLQTVEISQLFVSNKQNLFEAYMKNDFEFLNNVAWGAQAYGSLHNGVFKCGNLSSGSNLQWAWNLIKPHVDNVYGSRLKEDNPIVLANKVYNISFNISIVDHHTVNKNHNYNIRAFDFDGNEVSVRKATGGQAFLSTWSNGVTNPTPTNFINLDVIFSKDVYCFVLHADYGGLWVFDCTITDFTICEPENAKPDVPLVYEYIDLPQPVQLNSLPDGTCDTYNPITGEYVQNVGTIQWDSNIVNWNKTWSLTSSTGYAKLSHVEDWGNPSYETLVNEYSMPSTLTTQNSVSSNATMSREFNGGWSYWGAVEFGAGKLAIIIPREFSGGINEALQYLDENPLIINYKRTEPITTQLTPINIPTFEGGIVKLITTDGKVFPMIEYSMPTNNRYDTSSWETGAVYTQRNMTEAYFNESTTPMIPTETMTLTTDHISSGSIILNDNGNGLIVLKGNYTGRDIPYFTGMRSVEAIEVETTPSPDQPLFGKGGRK